MISERKRSLLIVLAMSGTIVTVLAACGDEQQQKTRVAFSAAFVPLTSGSIYDGSGELVATLDADSASELSDGEYYVDLRDEYGGSVFSEDGRLMFVPSVKGASLELTPHTVPGINTPLFAISVGDDDEPFAPAQGEHDYEVLGTSEYAVLDAATITAMHTQVVQEAVFAMTGFRRGSAANIGYAWSAQTAYSSFNYVGYDADAWARLRQAYRAQVNGQWVNGYYVSCRADNNLANNYGPCSILTGSTNPNTYTCQGQCPSRDNRYHGGQCMAFMNLLAYRSGIYHGPNWLFLAFNGGAIDGGAPNYPYVTPATIRAGDFLRRTAAQRPNQNTPHAVTVVRVTRDNRGNLTEVIVIDSNFVGPLGSETIGSHPMRFTGGNDYNDLGTYHQLACVYTEAGC